VSNKNKNIQTLYPPGVLNKGIGRSKFRASNYSKDTPLEVFNQLQTAHLTEDVIGGTGPYIAIVLKIVTPASGGEVVADSFPNQMAVFDGEKQLTLVQIRARIQELETLPAPSDLESDGDNKDLINMHPLFTAIDEAVEEPAPGEKVWVNFTVDGDRGTGIYLGPLTKQTTTKVTRSSGGAGASFANCGKSELSTSLKEKKPVAAAVSAVAEIFSGAPAKPSEKVPSTKVQTVEKCVASDMKTQKFEVTIGNFPGKIEKKEGKPRSVSQKKTMFVIHETGGGVGAFGMTDAAAKKAAHSGVQLWMARSGLVVQAAPFDANSPHGNWSNPISIGMEVLNPAGSPGMYVGKGGTVTKAGKIKDCKEGAENGYVIMGPQAVGHQNLIQTDKKVVTAWGGNYVFPSEIQCRRTWELISSIISSADNPRIQLDSSFSAVPAGISKFRWGLYPSSTECCGPNGYWRAGLMGQGEKPGSYSWAQLGTVASQRGITSHARWPSHSDGCYIEYYCLGRASNLDSESAFFAAVWAMYTASGLGGGRKYYSGLPTMNMASKGRQLWDNRPINGGV